MLKRTWTDEKLIEIMNDFPKSWANVCRKLGLKVLNSNRKNIKKRCEELGLPTEIVWRYSYTKNELREAVENSGSYRQVLMAVGVSPHGGGYEYVKNAIQELDLDISHFHHQAWNKGKKFDNRKNKTPLEEILVKNYQGGIGSVKIKKRVIEAGLLEEKCYHCNRTKWMGGGIPTHLHHKNGNNKDNRIENLTILCPNCHALTDTYTGKNIQTKRKKKKNKKGEKEKQNKKKKIKCSKICPTCKKVFYVGKQRKKQKYCCQKCFHKNNRKVKHPDKKQLEQEISNNTYKKLGCKYGVSSTAVRKWAKKYNLI